MIKTIGFIVTASVIAGIVMVTVNALVGYHAAENVGKLASLTHNAVTFFTGWVFAVAYAKWG